MTATSSPVVVGASPRSLRPVYARPIGPFRPRSTETAVPPRTHVLAAWLFIVLFSAAFAAFVGYEVAQHPLAPGGDPGHWLASSYWWVGLPSPPFRTVGQPLANYPLFLLILGLFVRAAGNPLGGGFLYIVFTSFFLGVSSGHLGWVLFRNPFFAPLFAALALCNVPLFTLIFTGALPNLLGFVFFNEAAAFLILFVRSLRTSDNLLFWGWAALLFLVHDLTFAVLAAFGVTFLVIMGIFGRLRRRHVARAENVIGVGLVLLSVVGYFVITSALGVSHPGYFFGNPGAFQLAGIGAILNSFSLPAVDPLIALGLLVGVAAGAIIALVAVAFGWPSQLDITLLAVGSMVIAVALLPVFGYLLHIDTDYVRLGFFLVVPLFLSALVVAERILGGFAAQLMRWPTPSVPPRERARRWRAIRRRDAAFDALTFGAVAGIAAAAFFFVAVPTGQMDEQIFAGSAAHGPGFVNASNFLRSYPTPGAVLAQVSNGVWIEALALRDSYFYGPTYFQFFPYQVQDMQSSYFAYTQRWVSTNNGVAVGYAPITPNATAQYYPTYFAFLQGVVFPLLRVSPADVGLVLSSRHGGGVTSVSAGNLSYGPPVFGTNDPYMATTTFTGRGARLVQTTDLAPAGGVAWLNYSFAGSGGVALSALDLDFSAAVQPPREVQFEPVSTGRAHGTANVLQWQTRGKLGLLPGLSTVFTNGTASVAASHWSTEGNASSPDFGLAGHFPAGNASSFALSIQLHVPGTANPAISFPTFFDTRTWLADSNIRFLLVPNASSFKPVLALFRSQYGFSTIYTSAQYTIAAD
jgi:hypothetical protein